MSKIPSDRSMDGLNEYYIQRVNSFKCLVLVGRDEQDACFVVEAMRTGHGVVMQIRGIDLTHCLEVLCAGITRYYAPSSFDHLLKQD